MIRNESRWSLILGLQRQLLVRLRFSARQSYWLRSLNIHLVSNVAAAVADAGLAASAAAVTAAAVADVMVAVCVAGIVAVIVIALVLECSA